MSIPSDNLDMSYLQDIVANWNPKEIAKAVEDAMFTYIYSNLSQDGQAVESCDYIDYLRMLRDTLLDVKPKDCVLS